MKARVKETGEIIELYRFSVVAEKGSGVPYTLEQLEFEAPFDYWEKLLHQYAGMAMQGLLNNNLLSSVLFKTGTTHVDYINEVVKVAEEYAHTLVEKMKEAK